MGSREEGWGVMGKNRKVVRGGVVVWGGQEADGERGGGGGGEVAWAGAMSLGIARGEEVERSEIIEFRRKIGDR